MKISRQILITLLMISSTINAQENEVEKKESETPKSENTKKVTQSPNKPIKLYYASTSWNQAPTKQDSAFLFLRDAKSEKVAKILLEETEPDSSTFEGNFSIGWTSADDLAPEIYVPPLSMRKNDKDSIAKFYQLLKRKAVSRMPLVYHKSPEGQQIIDVYDTPEQAKAAHEAYKKELEISKQVEETKQNLSKPIPNESTMETKAIAERQAVIDQLAQEAAKREADRIRLEQIEKQKAEERLQAQKALKEAEIQKRKNEAAKYAQKALEHYQKGEFAEAEVNFKKTLDLDPENTDYYFKYGITLYRNEKFNDALVTMNLAKVKPELELEKKYYMGLIHFRIKEFDSALSLFSQVQEANHPDLSPSAAFYRGLLLFNLEKYEEAKAPFEWVIDNSKDNTLDDRSEEYLEKIAQMIAYNKNKAKKFLLNGSLGLMYDSNVLLAPDNVESQGSSTEIADTRLLLTAGSEYRFYFEKTHELSAKYAMTYIHSSKDEVSTADPFLNAFSVPYVFKSTLFGKGYKLSVTPGTELLNMSIESGSTKETILSTNLITVDNTFIMNEKWISSYVIEYRMDDSQLSDSIGDNDGDSGKLTLKTSQSFFKDKSMKKAVIANLGYIHNNSKGKNKTYKRSEVGVTYMAPANKIDTWTAGLVYYKLNYPSLDTSGVDTPRTDTNIAFNGGYIHPLKEWVTSMLMFNYTNNNSNISSSQYNKYSLMAIATFNMGW